MKQLLLLSLLALALGSCTKSIFGSDETPPRGYVLETGIDTPIPNATVLLFEPTGQLFGPQSRQIGFTKTDENGYFEFDVEPNNSYLFDVVAEGYYGLDTPNGSKISLRNFDGNIRLIPNAYLLIEVQNVPPREGLDRIAINMTNCTPTPTSFVGADINERVFCTFPGNKENRVGWIIEPQGQEKMGFDSIMYFSAHDTTILKIQY
ncbi:MAG: hypothetical protein AAF798_20945 [Bacteroidota bacterium]